MATRRVKNDFPTYYAPYDSDNESTESSGSGAGASDFSKSQREDLQVRRVDDAEYATLGIAYSNAKVSRTKFQESRNTALIMINSRDRDTNVFPQPTAFSIRLPRVYRNVTNLAITQLKMLSSFYYFSEIKSNTTLQILEQGRVLKLDDGTDINNAIQVKIRQGTYNSSTLVAELNQQLNRTPLFADINGGRDAFIARFQVSGSFSELFNEPGDTVYNSLTDSFDTGITKVQLISRYFFRVNNAVASTRLFTVPEAVVAYYYPMLREMVIDGYNFPKALNDSEFIGTILQEGSLAGTGETPFDRIVYGFRGLQDNYITAIVTNPDMQVAMEEYRSKNTYKYFLANRYVCSYDSTVGRFKIVSRSISTSIAADLTTTQNQFLTEELNAQGLSTASLGVTQTTINNQVAALSDLYNYIHNGFTNFFGIDFGLYTRDFFADLSNEIILYDPSGNIGFSKTLSSSILGKQISTSLILPPDISGVWPYIENTKTDHSDLVRLDDQGTIDLSGSSEKIDGFQDIQLGIKPRNYGMVGFQSRCRQNMRFLTLPRTTMQKMSLDASEAYVMTPDFFSLTGESLLDPITPGFLMFDVSQVMLEDEIILLNDNRWVQYVQQQKPVRGTVQLSELELNISQKQLFLQLNTDGYAAPPGVINYKFPIAFYVTAPGGFTADTEVYWYRDRAAFMLDVSNVLVTSSSESLSRKHYFGKFMAKAGDTKVKIRINTLSFTQHYFIVRSPSLVITTPLQVYSLLDDLYGVFTPVSDEIEFRKMPIVSLTTDITPDSTVFKSTLKNFFFASDFHYGYSAEGISNNYNDYFIRAADGTGFDPVTYDVVTKKLKFSFNLQSQPSNAITNGVPSIWFYRGSKNRVLNLTNGETALSANNIGSFRAVRNRLLLCSPFAQSSNNPEYIINPQETTTGPFGVSFNPLVAAGESTFYLLRNQTPTINDISFNPVPSVLNQTILSFGPNANGIFGFTIKPPANTIFSVGQVVIKFAYLDVQNPLLVEDTHPANTLCTQLGIFRTSYLEGKPTSTLSISESLGFLTRTKVARVGTFVPIEGFTEPTRNRNPDWGTYYVFDAATGLENWIQPITNGADLLISYDKTFSVVPFDASGSAIPLYGLSYTLLPSSTAQTTPDLGMGGNWILTNRNGILERVSELAVTPLVKVALDIEEDRPNPATDLSLFGGEVGIQKEFGDSVMFLYDNSQNRLARTIFDDERYGFARINDFNADSYYDISEGWGQESGTIYKQRDDDSGYNFLSYIHDVPIRKGNGNYLHIRGYVPTNQFTTGLRFIGRNWTHFGTLRLDEIIAEIDELYPSGYTATTRKTTNDEWRRTGGRYFTREYTTQLLAFNDYFFNQGKEITFGLNSGDTSFTGLKLKFSQTRGFRDAITAYVSLYEQVNANQNAYSTAVDIATLRLRAYVLAKYSGILPEVFLNRNRITDPIPFSIQLRSALISPFNAAFDEWGLGWNLGFDKVDTPFNVIHTAATFIRIVEDYIYLRMNDEYGMNTIDITEKEDLAKSQETFGQSSRYFAKLLLNNFGSFAQTFVQSPKQFLPVLGKLEKLSFTWVDRFGNPIDNVDCEFNVTLQIQELSDRQEDSSTLDRGT